MPKWLPTSHLSTTLVDKVPYHGCAEGGDGRRFELRLVFLSFLLHGVG